MRRRWGLLGLSLPLVLAGCAALPAPLEALNRGITEFDALGATLPGETTSWLVLRITRDLEAGPGVPRIASGLRLTYDVNHVTYTATSDFVAGFGVESGCDPEES